MNPKHTPISDRISYTEIAARVRGIMADLFAVGCNEAQVAVLIRFAGITHGTPRSTTAVMCLVDRVEKSFGVALADAHEPDWPVTGTVGDLIALVEGALSEQERMA